MDLLEALDDAPLATLEPRRLDFVGRPAALQPAEQAFGGAADPLVIDRAGGAEDHLVRAVMVGHETREIVLAKARDPFRGAEDGAPQSLTGIGGLLQPVEDDIVGRVERLADLLQDHAALDLDLLVREQRLQQDVGDDVERESPRPRPARGRSRRSSRARYRR